MSLEATRLAMNRYWAELDHEFTHRKNSQRTLLELSQKYKELDLAERAFVDQIVTEWVASSNPRMQFDALSLVDEFQIRVALSQLRALELALEGQTDAESRFTRRRVREIIARLTASD